MGLEFDIGDFRKLYICGRYYFFISNYDNNCGIRIFVGRLDVQSTSLQSTHDINSLRKYWTGTGSRPWNTASTWNVDWKTTLSTCSWSVIQLWHTVGESVTSINMEDLLWTEEVGVCLESDICEERLLELKRPLTNPPRRRAVGHVCVCLCVASVGLVKTGFVLRSSAHGRTFIIVGNSLTHKKREGRGNRKMHI